jgi:transcriptional regulator GlxA family with amidase domain
MEQRPETLHDYQQRIISVLVYVDQHKSDPLRVEDLAGIACFSPFHFHRLFHAFVGARHRVSSCISTILTGQNLKT